MLLAPGLRGFHSRGIQSPPQKHFPGEQTKRRPYNAQEKRNRGCVVVYLDKRANKNKRRLLRRVSIILNADKLSQISCQGRKHHVHQCPKASISYGRQRGCPASTACMFREAGCSGAGRGSFCVYGIQSPAWHQTAKDLDFAVTYQPCVPDGFSWDTSRLDAFTVDAVRHEYIDFGV